LRSLLRPGRQGRRRRRSDPAVAAESRAPAEQAAPAVRDARRANQQTTEGGNRSSRPQCRRYSPGRLAPYALARCSVLVVLVFVLVVIVDVVLIGVSGVIGIIVIRIGRIGLARVRSQLLLELIEVGVRAVVLQLPSYLDLLCLCAAATHWRDPLRRHVGRIAPD